MTECRKEEERGPTIVIESPQRSSALKPPNTVAAIPCFNTQPFIADVISKARKYVNQVIVVDDGSRDGTAEAARRAGAVVIRHGSNEGYGDAIKSCFEAARANAADVLVTLDGDGQHNPDEIPRVLAPIVQGKADLVIGSRFITNEHNMPRYRRCGIVIINFLWNFGSKAHVSDTQSGFRAYGRRVTESLSLVENGMAVSIEILEKARRQGAIIVEVPVSCSYISSAFGWKAIRHGLGVAFSILRIRLKNTLGTCDNA